MKCRELNTVTIKMTRAEAEQLDRDIRELDPMHRGEALTKLYNVLP